MDDGATISHSVLAAYTCAIMDLWRVQAALGRTPTPPGRPKSVTELLQLKKREEVERDDVTLKDRGAGTMVDQVSLDDLSNIARSFFCDGTENGSIYTLPVSPCTRQSVCCGVFINMG